MPEPDQEFIPSSRWCDWCREPITVGVIEHGVVVFHLLCWRAKQAMLGAVMRSGLKGVTPLSGRPKRRSRASPAGTLVTGRHARRVRRADADVEEPLPEGSHATDASRYRGFPPAVLVAIFGPARI